MKTNLKVENIEELKRNIKGYLKDASTNREKHAILRPGGIVVRNAAKKRMPVSKKNHFYYRNKKKTEIQSGNLKNSMYVFREVVGLISVGPRVLRSLSGKNQIGDNPKNSSGYYSHMIYGDAKAFRQKITEPALNSSLTKVNAAIAKSYERFNKRIAKKYGLQ